MIQWLLAFRYFIKRPVTWVAVVAVTLCVFIVLVVMTVMNGLVREFKQLNHNYAGDCVIESDSLVGFGYYEAFLEQLRQQPYVKAVSPVVKGVGLLTFKEYDWQTGIEICGIDPVLHAQATAFEETLHYKKQALESAFEPEDDPGADGCITGIEVIPFGRRKPDGTYSFTQVPPRHEFVISVFPLNIKGGLLRTVDFVNTKTFIYADDSNSGLVKSDSFNVYIPLEQAQILCGMDTPIRRISSIHVRFTDKASQPLCLANVRGLWSDFVRNHVGKPGSDLFDSVKVQSWQENRRSMIAPMEKEQMMMTMLFLMLGIITVFIVFVVLYMIICHKSKDIGILKSIGLSISGVFSVFLIFSVQIGLAGAVFGGLSGGIFLWKVNDLEAWLFEHYQWQLWDRTVYFIGDIPNTIEPKVVGIIVASALTACMIGAIMPGLQAARKTPVESLQVNQL